MGFKDVRNVLKASRRLVATISFSRAGNTESELTDRVGCSGDAEKQVALAMVAVCKVGQRVTG